MRGSGWGVGRGWGVGLGWGVGWAGVWVGWGVGWGWGVGLGWAIGGTVVVHLAFYKLLRVPLPWGVIPPFY